MLDSSVSTLSRLVRAAFPAAAALQIQAATIRQYRLWPMHQDPRLSQRSRGHRVGQSADVHPRPKDLWPVQDEDTPAL